MKKIYSLLIINLLFLSLTYAQGLKDLKSFIGKKFTIDTNLSSIYRKFGIDNLAYDPKKPSEEKGNTVKPVIANGFNKTSIF